MAGVQSENSTAIGMGTRRKKLAGFIKSANELRQSYQQSYGLGLQRDGTIDYDDSGMPGAFPDVAIARSGDEEMLLFPSYARRHEQRKQSRRDPPGTSEDLRYSSGVTNTNVLQQEWDNYEEANSVIEVDVRGWIYSPQKGQISRYNRAMIALARRMSGIPAPTSSRASSPNSAHHSRIESRTLKHDQELVDQEAESITRKGKGEQNIAWQGRYSEASGHRQDMQNGRSLSAQSRTPSPGQKSDVTDTRPFGSHRMTSSGTDNGNAPGPGALAKRASWNQPSEMSAAEISVANSHMMRRLGPFLTTPLTSTPLTIFFYNDETSRSRTVYTNEAGHFNFRAALDFVPTNVRVLASENLSANEEIRITEPRGVSLISDVDDTIKHSAIGAGAREVFRNVFIRDLADLQIDGVENWYNQMANMGVKLHYVSNMPWQLFPVLMSFLKGAGLPKGSFHLKHYTGMLQGIFEPVAERKKGTLDRIMSDFPQRRFILVGDSGEADLELYCDIVQANPGRVLGIFIRDVTTKEPLGFFNSSTAEQRRQRRSQSPLRGSLNNSTTHTSKTLSKSIERKPALPPRQQTRSSSSITSASSAPTMGQLIDLEEPTKVARSSNNGQLPEQDRMSSMSSIYSLPSHRPAKPPVLRRASSDDLDSQTSSSAPRTDLPRRKPAPPLPPKPRKFSTAESNPPLEPSPLSQAQKASPPSSRNSSPERQGYRSSVRNKASTIYNSLPSFYSPLPIQQQQVSHTSSPRPLADRSVTSTGSSANLSSRDRPPVPPRRNVSSYPAAAAHYATNRFSGGLSGYSADSQVGENNMATFSKKEEMWRQRWANAVSLMKANGVLLRSWRVGTDVIDEAVKLVERANREEEQGVEWERKLGRRREGGEARNGNRAD